jgi:hypothetical protein
VQGFAGIVTAQIGFCSLAVAGLAVSSLTANIPACGAPFFRAVASPTWRIWRGARTPSCSPPSEKWTGSNGLQSHPRNPRKTSLLLDSRARPSRKSKRGKLLTDKPDNQPDAAPQVGTGVLASLSSRARDCEWIAAGISDASTGRRSAPLPGSATKTPAHRALHRAVAGQVQELLALTV